MNSLKADVCIHMAWRNGFEHNADTHITDLPNHFTFVKNMIAGGLPAAGKVMGTMHEVGYWEGNYRNSHKPEISMVFPKCAQTDDIFTGKWNRYKVDGSELLYSWR